MNAVHPNVQARLLPALCLVLLLTGSISAGPVEAAPHPSHPVAQHQVDINRASLDELLRVPGLTRTWAGRIVRFRPYRTKQDLLDRGVLPGDVYRRVKDSLIAHREKP